MPLESIAILAQVYLRAANLWPAAATAAALFAVAVLLLYPAQLGDIRWPWRGVLPGLRLLAAVALAASLLKPVALRPATAEERGAVVMLVDRSRSMAVVDNTRTPAQLVALADALGKLPKDLRSQGATALAAEIERLRTIADDVKSAQEDLDYARVSGRDIQFRQKRLTDAAARYNKAVSILMEKVVNMPDAGELVSGLSELTRPPDIASREGWRTTVPGQIRQAVGAIAQFQSSSDDRLYESNADVRNACDSVATLSRFALVEQALLRPDGVLARSRKEAAVIGFGVAEELTPLTLEPNQQQPATSLGVVPDGDRSDLTGCIARAVAGRPVRAVVLFSDGRQVGPESMGVAGLTPPGVPIFTVSAAGVDPPLDLSFASVSAPSSVFAGQSIAVKADLRHDGFDGDRVELHCQIGQEPEQVRKITLHAGKPAAAEFTARLNKPGVQRLRLWFPRVSGEASGDNNQVERWVKVVPERMKVLLIAGTPTWDFQFVRSALSRMPEVQLKEAICDPANPRLWLAPNEILAQDAIILFDVPAAAFDEKHWDAIERAARVAGGSVTLVAGPSHLPAEYYKFVPTAALLPFRAPFKPAWRVGPLEDPSVHFDPTAAGEALEFLKLPREPDAAEGEPPRRWEQLPAFFRFLLMPEIHDEKSWKPSARPLLVEEQSRLPALTEMRLGAGRAFFVGFDETWRWRFKVGDRDQDHFWRQLIQYASEDPYFAHDGPLALDADKVSAEPGQAIHVRARISEELPDPQPSFSLQVLSDGHVISEQPLSPVGAEGGGRYGTSLALGAGNYEIRWSVHGAGKKVHTVHMPLHVAATAEAELADLSGDPKMLRNLADASGGEFLTLEQVNRLPERLAAAGDSQTRFTEMTLWDSPWLFAIVVGCFGTEWALRKRLGLA